MKRRLAALALDPKVTIQFLSLVELDLSLNKDVHFARLATLTDDVLVAFRQDSLTAHASRRHDCEAAETSVGVNLHLCDGLRVITRKKLLFCLLLVTEDGIENTEKRQLDLIFDIIGRIDR